MAPTRAECRRRFGWSFKSEQVGTEGFSEFAVALMRPRSIDLGLELWKKLSSSSGQAESFPGDFDGKSLKDSAGFRSFPFVGAG
jgi:hypothetical protein